MTSTSVPLSVISFAHAPVGAPLVRVCGLSLVLRDVLACQSLGGGIVVVIRPEDEAATVHELADGRIRVDTRVVTTAALEAGADGALPPLTAEVALVLGDRVFSKRVVTALGAPLDAAVPGRTLVGADGAPGGFFRLTRSALEREGMLGVLARPAVAVELGRRIDTAGGAREELGGEWQVVSGPADLRPAERLLFAGLVKNADGVISRHINRKISLGITRLLADTDLRPNHVSAVVLLVGLAGGVCAGLGGHALTALGAGLYYLSAILDGCDGELARLKYLGTPLGAWVDTVVDDAVVCAFACGMYLTLARSEPLFFWIALVGLTGFFLTTLPHYWLFATRLGAGDYQQIHHAPGAPPPTGFAALVQAVRTVLRFDFIPFAAFLVCLAGWPGIFGVGFALGTTATAIGTGFTVVRVLRTTAGG